MPDDKKTPPPRIRKTQAQQLLEASSIGWMFPLAIGIGYLMGYGLDRLFHTSPWLTWIFAGFGVIAAFLNLFRTGMEDDGADDPPES